MAERTDPPNPSGFDIELLLKQARTYLAFGEQLQPLSERFHETMGQSGDWSEALRQHFDEFKAALAGAANDPDGHPDLARLWTVTLDTWRQAAAALGVPTTLAPLAGANGEAWRTYQKVQDQYLDCLRQAARDALDLMEQRLSERAATGATGESLRELYNLWVECNEQTYGRMLRGPDYGVLIGRLINALLSCRASGGTPA
ncbi:MAG: poly(R)-hydroxyalkanoic acid synthase subunit PhaE [Candidatus Contendobacter sp.]|nr:poly(R)-hydroxyalkanoic acid synthase subunit PhaE [Candidatus Contendobacter sp.]MDG4557863.1 poly(R)-hydroxyalkanoic acid synthase subunit PhaE [Candidatus Contendobacter sp.]